MVDMAPSNSQWDDAVRNYCLNILKVKKIAVIGDTTGYGVTAVGASVTAFKKDGADVVYQANVDATQPDMPSHRRCPEWAQHRAARHLNGSK